SNHWTRSRSRWRHLLLRALRQGKWRDCSRRPRLKRGGTASIARFYNMNRQSNISRRRAIAQFGAVGMAAFGASGVIGAEKKEEVMTTETLQDPKTKYPKPPFKEQ